MKFNVSGINNTPNVQPQQTTAPVAMPQQVPVQSQQNGELGPPPIPTSNGAPTTQNIPLEQPVNTTVDNSQESTNPYSFIPNQHSIDNFITELSNSRMLIKTLYFEISQVVAVTGKTGTRYIGSFMGGPNFVPVSVVYWLNEQLINWIKTAGNVQGLRMRFSCYTNDDQYKDLYIIDYPSIQELNNDLISVSNKHNTGGSTEKSQVVPDASVLQNLPIMKEMTININEQLSFDDSGSFKQIWGKK